MEIIIGTVIGSVVTLLVAWYVARNKSRFNSLETQVTDVETTVHQRCDADLRTVQSQTDCLFRELEMRDRELDSRLDKLESRLIKQLNK
jgi:hypothetical protein